VSDQNEFHHVINFVKEFELTIKSAIKGFPDVGYLPSICTRTWARWLQAFQRAFADT